MKNWIKIAPIAVLLAGISIPLFAAHHGGDAETETKIEKKERGKFQKMKARKGAKSPRGNKRLDPGLMLIQRGQALELTAEQENQILAASQTFREETSGLRDEAKAVREKMKAFKDAGEYNEDELVALLDEMHPIKVKGAVAMASYRSTLGDILTAEQQEKIEAAKERMKNRFGNMRERMKGKFRARMGSMKG